MNIFGFNEFLSENKCFWWIVLSVFGYKSWDARFSFFSMKKSVNRFNRYATVFCSIKVCLLIIKRRKRKGRLKINDRDDQYCERTANMNDSVTYLLCSSYSHCEREDTSFIHGNKRPLEKKPQYSYIQALLWS